MQHQRSLKNSPKRALLGVAAAVVLGVGIAAGAMLGLGGSATAPSINQAAVASAATAAIEPVALPLVSESEREAAIDTLDLSVTDSAALLDAVENGQVRLGWLDVWDSQKLDGDVVQIQSDGVTATVVLQGPQRIAIPVPAAGLAYIYAGTDGGGGVTLGVRGSGGTSYLPVLAPGQAVAVPVR